MKIKKFEFNMFPVNCYVLSDETKEAVIIDAGCFYEEEKQALKRYIDSNSLTVKHLLNTHLHLDHIFGNPFLLQEYGLKAEANQADEFWLEQAPAQSRMFGFQLPECKHAPFGIWSTISWATFLSTSVAGPPAPSSPIGALFPSTIYVTSEIWMPHSVPPRQRGIFSLTSTMTCLAVSHIAPRWDAFGPKLK